MGDWVVEIHEQNGSINGCKYHSFATIDDIVRDLRMLSKPIDYAYVERGEDDECEYWFIEYRDGEYVVTEMF